MINRIALLLIRKYEIDFARISRKKYEKINLEDNDYMKNDQ
jgi:hypothetical protein